MIDTFVSMVLKNVTDRHLRSLSDGRDVEMVDGWST